MVLLLHLWACATSPFPEAWVLWVMTTLFTLLLAAMLICVPKLLMVARWICYAGFAVSGIALLVGIIGFLEYSVDLAVYLVAGIGWAFMFAINLAGIHEAEHKMSRQDR